MEKQKKVKIQEGRRGSMIQNQNDDVLSNNNQIQSESLKIENIFEEFKLYEQMQQTDQKIMKQEQHFLDHLSLLKNNNKEKKQKLYSIKQLYTNIHNIVLDCLELEQKQIIHTDKIQELKSEYLKKQDEILMQEHSRSVLDNKIKEYEGSHLKIKEEIFTIKELIDIVDRKKEHLKEEIIELTLKSSFMHKELIHSQHLLQNEDDFQKIKLLKQKENREKKKKILSKDIKKIQKIRCGISEKVEIIKELKHEINLIEEQRDKMNMAKQDSFKFIQELDIIDQISQIFIKGNPNPDEIDLNAIQDINNNDDIINEYFDLELLEQIQKDLQETNSQKDETHIQQIKFKKIIRKSVYLSPLTTHNILSPQHMHQLQKGNNFYKDLQSESPSKIKKSQQKQDQYQNLDSPQNMFQSQKTIEFKLTEQEISQQSKDDKEPPHNQMSKSYASFQFKNENNIIEKQKETINKLIDQVKNSITIQGSLQIKAAQSIIYFFIKKCSSKIVSQSREKITDRINKFLNDNEHNVEKLSSSIFFQFQKLQMEDVTMKNRLSDMNSYIVQLKKEYQQLLENSEQIKSDIESQAIDTKYQDQMAEQNIYLENVLDLKEKIEILDKNPVSIDKYFLFAERVISTNFYFFNEMIFRFTSIISALFERGGQSNIKSNLQKLSSQLQLFTKKIQNVLSGDQQNFEEKLKSLDPSDQQKEVIANSRQEELLISIKKFKKEEFNFQDKFLNHLRTDFLLFNFLKIEDLNNFLEKYCSQYQCNDEFYTKFKSIDFLLIENSLELKDLAIIGYEKSLEFLMIFGQDLLVELKESIHQQQNYLEQEQLVKNQVLPKFNLPRISSLSQNQSQQDQNQNINDNKEQPEKSTQKIYRIRAAKQKCREYDLHYGIENNQMNKSRAETIVDVIYESIFDILRNIKADTYDKDQEDTFFDNKRFQFHDQKQQIQKEQEQQQQSMLKPSYSLLNLNAINNNALNVWPVEREEDQLKRELIKIDSNFPQKQSKIIQKMSQNLIKKLQQAQLLYQGHKLDYLYKKPTNFIGQQKHTQSSQNQQCSDTDREKLIKIKQEQYIRENEKINILQKFQDQSKNNKKLCLQQMFFRQKCDVLPEEQEFQDYQQDYQKIDEIIETFSDHQIYDHLKSEKENSKHRPKIEIKNMDKINSQKQIESQLFSSTYIEKNNTLINKSKSGRSVHQNSSNIVLPEPYTQRSLSNKGQIFYDQNSIKDSVQSQLDNTQYTKNLNITKNASYKLGQHQLSISYLQNQEIIQQSLIQTKQQIQNINFNKYTSQKMFKIPNSLKLKSLELINNQNDIDFLTKNQKQIEKQLPSPLNRNLSNLSSRNQSLGSIEEYIKLKQEKYKQKSSPYEFKFQEAKSVKNSRYPQIEQNKQFSDSDYEKMTNQIFKNLNEEKYFQSQQHINSQLFL